jgi:DNA-binding transcriptional ArsR family regulator
VLAGQDLNIFFRALADRKRMRIALHLAQHERVTVSELGVQLRLSQPLISWHLRVLRRAGIVRTERSGRQVYCSLNRQSLESYQQKMNESFRLNGTRQHDEDQRSRERVALTGIARGEEH